MFESYVVSNAILFEKNWFKVKIDLKLKRPLEHN